MSTVELLSFTLENYTPYFDAGIDLELYDQDEEEWFSLRSTDYSPRSLVDALENGHIKEEHVRFTEEDASAYLVHLKETGIEEQLHQERLMNRSRLVALADNDYTTTQDFLGTADPIDISKETGVERSIVSEIATNHVGGFSSAGSFGDGGPLESLSPSDDFRGWNLTTNTDNRIRWVTSGGFRLTITPTPDDSVTVTGNAPNDERHPWYRKGWSVEPDPDSILTPEVALDRAHEWLADHELVYSDDLAALPQIGPATRDYLALDYEITTIEGLRDFATTNRDKFDDIFGDPGRELLTALEVEQ
ncbi:hypothetical protein [Salinilacihabitans rarus]|uniref:hypothetical protein n=1 Tax=Salinilacihabitans rarus TaxID=2961596 RepID=UPI0020C8618C|nr:hypothetical protein [Salinilacihabitans rarus]